MGERGVTRMAHGDHPMSEADREHMRAEHHKKTLWVWWTLVLLGLWMVVAPLTLDYGRSPAVPPGPGGVGARELPLSLETRVAAMYWSDLLSGVLLVIFGWRTLTPGRPVSKWLACFVGVWLQFAPLVFWSPSPAAYLNDTLVGMLVIALTILVPGMPGMMMIMKPGPTVPPGWTYNPSSWPQRGVMIALAFAGLVVSRLLAAYQLGYTPRAFEPFFGAGTVRVLTSDMSRSLPISDAALGVAAYTFEFLMGWMGSPARWRTMPWMVLFFGILVVPLGLTHIVLVISQPVVVGEWCTLCLLAALIMLPMIPLTLDEVVAMGQFMVRRVKGEGQPFWRTFWLGDTDEGEKPDERSPELGSFPGKPVEVLRAGVWGVSVPWQLALATALGVWLVFAPSVFGTTGPAADSDHLSGALIVTVAVVAMAEVGRAFRFLNVPLGLWVALAPWVLSGAALPAQLSGLVVGLAVAALSFPRGVVYERYGGWDRYVM
jgi:uncharacterized membrane protein